MLRDPLVVESVALVELAAGTEPWESGGADALLGETLQQYHAGQLGPQHRIKVWEDAGVVQGWSYYAENTHAPGVWDVWWIGVRRDLHRQGAGSLLLSAIEADIRSQSGRLVVIETSATPPMQKARQFYAKMGYMQSGLIPHFYGMGDDKVIFSKVLGPESVG